MIRKILLGLLLALIVIQFIHPPKNESKGVQPNFIGHAYPIPSDVQVILKKACLDCHSNNTEYPWYSKLQPVDWWMDKHVKDGKKHVNYDEYMNRSVFYRYHKMEETVEMIEENEMPLESYTWIHKDAKLTAEEKHKVIEWAKGVMADMKATYPADSLVRAKKKS